MKSREKTQLAQSHGPQKVPGGEARANPGLRTFSASYREPWRPVRPISGASEGFCRIRHMDSGPTSTETLLIALGGGAIGAVLTGFAWLLTKLASVPGDLQRHDFEVRVLNEDLELWAADDYRRIRRELTEIEDVMRSQGSVYSEEYGRARAEVKTEALHRWRDRLHESERKLVGINASEGRRHRVVRRMSNHHRDLDLTAPTRVKPIIEEFRRGVTKHGKPAINVFDPTRFKLDALLYAIEGHPLEPAIPPTVENVSDGAGGFDRTIHNKPPQETPDVPGLSGPVGSDS